MMDMYSRLLVQLSTVNGNDNDNSFDPSFVKDLSVLESPNEELADLIKDDLPSILPAILILSVHEDISIRTAIARTFNTFCSVLSKNPSVKQESWWKEMETKLIAHQFSAKLGKMVEVNDEPWANNWAFVTRLVIHDEHVHGVAINSMLKVVETAFKMSKKNDAIMEKAYFCWNQLIDIFSKNPRVVCSQKLVELLVKPLSTTHLSLKCPDLKMETWYNLMKKIGFLCGNKSKFVIEPFIEFMYLKGDKDSLYVKYSKKCMEAYADMTQQKKVFKHYALKLISAFTVCYESCNSEELEPLLIKIWTGILENIQDVDKNNRNEYILEIFTRFHQALQIEKPELNKKLMKILVDKNLFNIDNLRTCIMSESSLVSIFSDFMKYEDFRHISFSKTVKDLMDNFSDTTSKKPQNNINLQIWDVLCEIYSMWIKNIGEPQESLTVDNETLGSLLMIPFTYKQWSVGVQKTWYSLVDSVHSTPASIKFLMYLVEKFSENVKESLINAASCIEICTHILNKDKSAITLMMPILRVASVHLPPKDPKPLLDMLVLLENAVSRVPKSDLSKFLNELLIYGNKYDQPYGLRIKTKISKVQRKLFTLKENEGKKESENLEDNEQPSGNKTRSPIIAQSSFLQRLAKAEEKKKKKHPTMSSIFGDSAGGNQPSRADSPEGKQSPIADSPEPSHKNEGLSSLSITEKKENEVIIEQKEGDENKDLTEALTVNGRCSPVMPQTVHIVKPSRPKRSQTKSPEPTSDLKDSNKKSGITKMPPPPTYFEDDAQDFVMVPPKSKKTPLTEHQKEVLSKRRTDIPALYQDLSQDTNTDSQSLKEIILVKENNTSGVTCASEISKSSSEPTSEIATISKDTINKEENSDSDPHKPVPDVKSVCDKKDNDSAELKKNNMLESIIENNACNSSETTSTSTKEAMAEEQKLVPVNVGYIEKTSEANIPDMSGDPVVKPKLIEESNEDPTSLDSESNENKQEDSLNKSEDSEEIIESTPQFEPAVSLNLTPTKHPGPPTPRNLIRRINLIETDDSPDNKKNKFIEDTEEEIGKENIITNSKQITEKSPANSVKRRSMRKSLGKFSTKKPDDVKEVKVKSKKELIDSLKEVTEEDSKESRANLKDELVPVADEAKTLMEVESVTEAIVTPQNQSEDSTNKTHNSCDNVIGIDKTIEVDKPISKVLAFEENKVLNEGDGLHKTKLIEGNSNTEVHCLTEEKHVAVPCDTDSKIESIDDPQSNKCEDSAEPKSAGEDMDISVKNNENKSSISTQNCSSPVSDAKNVSVSSRKNDENIICLSDEETSESPSADVTNWALTTPEKGGKRKKKSEVVLSPRFSPKQLRSKRLSLTKSQVTPVVAKKKMRKSAPTSSLSKIDNQSVSENAQLVSKPSDGVSNNLSNVEPKDVSMENEVLHSGSGSHTETTNTNTVKKSRKRKSQGENSEEVEGKKSKSDVSSEEINQESILIVKNNIVKPRKKKIIKANVKHSPNNLEQWLIKTGKAVFKTSLISQENTGDESDSKIIEDNKDIQIDLKVDIRPSPTRETSPQKEVIIPKIEISSSSPINKSEFSITQEKSSLHDSDVIIIDASPDFDNSSSDDLLNCTLISESSFQLNISSGSESGTTDKVGANQVLLETLQCNETSLPASTSDDADENIAKRLHRRKRRLLKREETPFREGFASPDDESFDAKKERLTTPFRSGLGRSRRSAQMVMMATGEDDQEQAPQPHTPDRRANIPAVNLGENWPEGRLEEWVPCVPTPPGINPSPGILRRRPVLSPQASPSSSPRVQRKRRVSFLDPPVSKGLLYCKGETLGQVQHADIPPGETPLWKDEDNTTKAERPEERPGPSGLMNNESVDGGFGAAEGEDELTAIQEFLNSTPDAPWSKAIPPELDIKQIAGLELCTESVEKLLPKLTTSEEERSLLLEEMKTLGVTKVADLCSIDIMNLNKLCEAFSKMKTLTNIIEEYLKEKTSQPEERKLEGPTVIKDENVAIKENIVTIGEVKPVDCQSVKAEPVSSCTASDSDVEHVTQLLLDDEFLNKMADKFPLLLGENSPFLHRLAEHVDFPFLARFFVAVETQKGKKPG